MECASGVDPRGRGLELLLRAQCQEGSLDCIRGIGKLYRHGTVEYGVLR